MFCCFFRFCLVLVNYKTTSTYQSWLWCACRDQIKGGWFQINIGLKKGRGGGSYFKCNNQVSLTFCNWGEVAMVSRRKPARFALPRDAWIERTLDLCIFECFKLKENAQNLTLGRLRCSHSFAHSLFG